MTKNDFNVGDVVYIKGKLENFGVVLCGKIIAYSVAFDTIILTIRSDEFITHRYADWIYRTAEEAFNAED